MRGFRAFASTLCAVALLSCGKAKRLGSAVDDPAGGGGEGGAPSGGSSGSSGTAGALQAGGAGGGFGTAGRGGAGAAGGHAEGGDVGCVSEVPPEAPLRRLNRFEYENSLRALFGDQSVPTDALPVDPYEERGAAPTPALVEAQHLLARDLALQVTQTESATHEFIGCNATAQGEAVCRDRFIGEFVASAFRRPLTDSEIEQFTVTFDGGASGGGFPLGVRAVIQVALQSPEFLYLPEFGVEAPERGDGFARPGPYEAASRLSYFLWDSPPDAELLEAARKDALREPDELEAHARRMLADPRAVNAVGNFYLRLLRLDGATFPAAGLAQYPTFTPEIAGLLLTETQAFVADVTLVSNGDLRTLLTAPYTFVNGPLAAFYELDGASGDEFQRVDVDSNQRGGVLTQASFLAATAQGPFTNPSARGIRIANAFLCQSFPGHPAEAVVPEPLPPNTTTRQRFAQHVDAACAACHTPIDPLGFAFEHYDAAGLYRDTENGVAIDATGTLATTDIAGDFDGALELADRLARSEDVRRCFAQNWFAHALERAVTPADACYLSTLDREFVEVATNLQGLLLAVVRNEAFLYRPEVAP